MTTTMISPIHDISLLDQLLGDPWDDANPVGFSAILAADERDETPESGERILDRYGLNAEFVPKEYGGRLSRLDTMIETLRAVYRRDPALALGYCGSSMLASLNVWAAGSEAQCRAVAALLLKDRKLACGYYELKHGNDLSRTQLNGQQNGESIILNGGKQVCANLQRAAAMVLFVRTSSEAGSRSHSQILVDKAELPADRMTYLPRFKSAGMRGVQLGGIEFHDCPVPATGILGKPGQGIETAIRSFQISRIGLPGMFAGILDTGLRTTIRYALGRRLYGGTVADIPHARSVIAESFADLLLCDAFVGVAARAVHLAPRGVSLYASAVKYLVPHVLVGAMNNLSVVMGAHSYLRKGEHAIFQKLARDLKPVSFGHAARVSCQMTIIPQLPRLARKAWLTGAEAPTNLFVLGDDLPPLSFARLGIDAGTEDPLMDMLATGLALLPAQAGQDGALLRDLGEGFLVRLADLKRQCAALSPGEMTVMASPSTYDLAARYASLAATAACLGVWLSDQKSGDAFRRDPAWIIAVLARLNIHLGEPTSHLPPEITDRLFAEAMARYEAVQTFDLAKRSLPGSQQPIPNS